MKRIISSKLDDIVRQEEDFNAKYKPLKEKYDEQVENWRQAYRGVQDDVAAAVRDAIGPTSIELDVRAEERYKSGYAIYIQANEYRKFNDESALAWHYEVRMDDAGNLTFESGSWSGLKATTPAQLKDLKESVRVLEVLQDLDWKSLLTVDTSRYDFDKFVDHDTSESVRDLERNKPNFSELKKAAQLDDLIGTHKVVEVNGLPDDGYRSGIFSGYLQIVSESPSTYTVREISKWDVDNASKNPNYLKYIQKQVTDGYTTRKKKANVLRTIDLDNIVDIDEL